MYALIFSTVFSTAGICLGCDTQNDFQILTTEQITPLAEHSRSTSEYAYVLAPGGLYLRAHNNLHSERLTLMPWGAMILIEQRPESNTMTVSGIPGTMYAVCFNGLQGYAFSGYLGPYAPPGHKMNAAEYAAYLQESEEISSGADSEAKDDSTSKEINIPQYSRTVSDDLSSPSVSESLFMPGMNLNQSYLVAQRLFGIPEDLKCPSVTGPENAVYPDKKPKKGIWKSELAVRRANGQIQEMTYLYRSKNFMRRVHLAPRENGVLIQAHEANIF